MAWATAFPHGADSDEEITVTLRHDNGTQFTSHHFREVADDLGIQRFRFPSDGKERLADKNEGQGREGTTGESSRRGRG